MLPNDGDVAVCWNTPALGGGPDENEDEERGGYPEATVPYIEDESIWIPAFPDDADPANGGYEKEGEEVAEEDDDGPVSVPWNPAVIEEDPKEDKKEEKGKGGEGRNEVEEGNEEEVVDTADDEGSKGENILLPEEVCMPFSWVGRSENTLTSRLVMGKLNSAVIDDDTDEDEERPLDAELVPAAMEGKVSCVGRIALVDEAGVVMIGAALSNDADKTVEVGSINP